MLFKTIVNSQKDVAIGPLEYCGNGTVIRTTHKQKKYFQIHSAFLSLTVHTTRVSAVRATREAILSQASTSNPTKFRLGYFSPRKACSESSPSLSSRGSESDHFSLDENGVVPEGFQSSDSDSFPVPRWNSPEAHSSMGNQSAQDVHFTSEHTVPSSPSLISAEDVSASEVQSDHDVASSASRKRRKTTHISADKALVLGADALPHIEAGPSSKSRATRHRTEVNYARVKRKYIRK